MTRDPLLILYAVRQRAVEQARQALGACLRTEAGVLDRIERLGESVRRDRDATGAVQDGHRFVDMFAVRQAAIRTDHRTATADLLAAEASCGEARAVVAAARSAVEAVEQLIGERAAAMRADATRREQHALDDIARPRHMGGSRLAR